MRTRIIVLTLVFIVSITSMVFAAPSNPFADVPSKHWAYDALAKLAQVGVVDGYGDGTFRGDRTMSRYEMAQIVARAMARSEKADADNKALIDKLAVEFASELNNLGVRVAKLEDKTKISWNFESRVRYGGDDNNTLKGSDDFDWRQRIYLNGAVNDNVTYFARLECGNNKFGTVGNQNVGFNRAGFVVKDFLGGIDSLTVGRFGTSGWTPGLLQAKTSNNDGIAIVKKLGDVSLRAAAFNVAPQSQVNFFSLGLKPADNLKLNVAYQTATFRPDASTVKWPLTGVLGSAIKTKSFDVSAIVKVGGFNLTGEYVSTKEETANDATKKAYAIQLTNGVTDNFYSTFNIVDPTKAHTDAFAISYRSIENNAVPLTSGFNSITNVFGTGSTTMNNDNDVKGYFLAYQNVVSKGVIWSVEFQDLKDKSTGSFKDKTWNTSFSFFF